MAIPPAPPKNYSVSVETRTEYQMTTRGDQEFFRKLYAALDPEGRKTQAQRAMLKEFRAQLPLASMWAKDSPIPKRRRVKKADPAQPEAVPEPQPEPPAGLDADYQPAEEVITGGQERE